MEDLLRKTTIAKDVLSKLSTHIQNDYNVNGEDGEVRGVESCCNFDKSKLSFDSIFGESVIIHTYEHMFILFNRLYQSQKKKSHFLSTHIKKLMF